MVGVKSGENYGILALAAMVFFGPRFPFGDGSNNRVSSDRKVTTEGKPRNSLWRSVEIAVNFHKPAGLLNRCTKRTFAIS